MRLDDILVEPVLPQSGYEQWRNEHFPDSEDRENEEISGPAANPAGDGTPNLLRYALGLDPWQDASPRQPRIVAAEEGGLEFRFPYDPEKAGLVWRVTASHDLASWPLLLWDSAEGEPEPSPEGWLSIAVPEQDPDAGDVRRLFLRLEVELE